MRNNNIVKSDFMRSHSTKSLKSKTNTGHCSTRKKSTQTSRDLSAESSFIYKPEKSFQDFSSSFIKPKPPKNALIMLNPTQETLCGSSITDLVSDFSIKSIEYMKKDFQNNEIIYTYFLALMSEIDEVFDKNPTLQFSFSNARDVFRLYMSRPGEVLLTIRSLPKTLSRIRLSKKILSQSYNGLKAFNQNTAKGVALRVYYLSLGIISHQRESEQETFISEESYKNTVKTQENLMTEDKSSDISIADINSTLNQSEWLFTEPAKPCDLECDIPLKPLNTEAKKSAKAKLIEQLYLKMNVAEVNKENSDCFKLATFGNQEEGKNESVSKDVGVAADKELEKISNGVPRYMRSLQRDGTDRSGKSCNAKENLCRTNVEFYETRKGMIRKNSRMAGDRNKMMKEDSRRKQEKIEVEEYLLAKKTIEKFEKKFLLRDYKRSAEMVGKTVRFRSSNTSRK